LILRLKIPGEILSLADSFVMFLTPYRARPSKIAVSMFRSLGCSGDFLALLNGASFILFTWELLELLL